MSFSSSPYEWATISPSYIQNPPSFTGWLKLPERYYMDISDSSMPITYLHLRPLYRIPRTEYNNPCIAHFPNNGARDQIALAAKRDSFKRLQQCMD